MTKHRTLLVLLLICTVLHLMPTHAGGAPEVAEQEGDGMRMLTIRVGDRTFFAQLEDNAATAELCRMLAQGERTFSATNYGGFEKIVDLGVSLPRDDRQTDTEPGDIMLYQGRKLVIFHAPNSWSYTRIGKITASRRALSEAFGGEEREVTLSLKRQDLPLPPR